MKSDDFPGIPLEPHTESTKKLKKQIVSGAQGTGKSYKTTGHVGADSQIVFFLVSFFPVTRSGPAAGQPDSQDRSIDRRVDCRVDRRVDGRVGGRVDTGG